MAEQLNPCITCHYARMRKDICGIYCAGSYWKEKDGTCKHWKDYKRRNKNGQD